MLPRSPVTLNVSAPVPPMTELKPEKLRLYELSLYVLPLSPTMVQVFVVFSPVSEPLPSRVSMALKAMLLAAVPLKPLLLDEDSMALDTPVRVSLPVLPLRV